MSKRGKKYSAEFKSRAVLDLLVGDKTIGEVCSERKVTSKTLQAWKIVFLKNARAEIGS